MTDIFIIATPWGNLNVLPICHDWTIHYCQVFNKTSCQFKNTCREKEINFIGKIIVLHTKKILGCTVHRTYDMERKDEKSLLVMMTMTKTD